MHNNDIIHHDLTTSNMILKDEIFFIDFGLSEYSDEMEKRGVDLHLMKRALQSTHYNDYKKYFKEILDGYTEVLGEKETSNVINKIMEIERRGRYVSNR